MLQAMFSGVSGLQAHQTKMSVIGNNIANVNTVGFKAGRVSFEDQLSQTIRSASLGTDSLGGTNPAQVGLGVILGSVDTLQTQGNLQTTGKNTDLAIQGGGFFVVSSGGSISYTRDGSFDLDGTGVLVNPATGQKLLGYLADAAGVIDTTAVVTPTSFLKIPLGKLGSVKQTGSAAVAGNLDAGATVYSTKVDWSGSLDASGASVPPPAVATVYDSLGNPHVVRLALSNPQAAPTGPGVPAGATQAWDVQVSVDGSVAFDSAAGKSRLYRVGSAWQFADASGAPLGATIALDGGTGLNHAGKIPGVGGADPLSLNLNLGALASAPGASSLKAAADGMKGTSPFWTTSLRVYDSLGVPHNLAIRYHRVPVAEGDASGAAARWDWTASENGTVIAGSADSGNSPLLFDAAGRLIAGAKQTIAVTPAGGAVPFTFTLDSSQVGQLASGSTVAADSQDGFPAGVLQSFAISQDGVITGVFSNGQTRPLGQIAMSGFPNPSGLEKIGNNLYRESNNSGMAQVGTPGTAGRGKISPGFLEMSNVDLSSEFTSLIITQRGFQANTRIVSVVDDLIQDVLNLKR